MTKEIDELNNLTIRNLEGQQFYSQIWTISLRIVSWNAVQFGLLFYPQGFVLATWGFGPRRHEKLWFWGWGLPNDSSQVREARFRVA